MEEGMVETRSEVEAIAYLRSPQAIRDRCGLLFDLCCQGDLQHFDCDLTRVEPTVEFVLDTLQVNYPDLEVPFHSRWRHFDVGGIPRLSVLDNTLALLSPLERTKTKLDLAIVSVLLDAGAGPDWHYIDPASGTALARSEGLAVASLSMFGNGFFSSDPVASMQVDAEGLQRIGEADLVEGFQVSTSNPLVGVSGRLGLLHHLGRMLEQQPRYFGSSPSRPGNLVDYWGGPSASTAAVTAHQMLATVLESLGPIWPGRVELGGVNLGDVWPHSALTGQEPGANLVPFHKLSQWLTYSLVEPLVELGWTVSGLDELTGLAEYRNGGLLVDMGVLVPKHDRVLSEIHSPGSEAIVEWRALTVVLLDRIAAEIRARLEVTAAEFPLVKILEGGTWSAGRRIARIKRPDGRPPIALASDGTVF